MALEIEIKEKIASIVGIRTDQIECDGAVFTDAAASFSLDVLSVFFPDAGSEEKAIEEFNAYCCKYTYDANHDCFISTEDVNDRIFFKQLSVRNQSLDVGIHDLQVSNYTKQPYISIAGGRTESEIDLSRYKEILYVMPKLQLIEGYEGSLGWTELLNCFGTFVVYFDDRDRICDGLVEYGLFPHRTKNFSLAWESSPDFKLNFPKIDVPTEAIRAYSAALEISDNPEIAFFLIYRAFEVLFAPSIKEKVSTADVREVIRFISNKKTTTELELLKLVIENSSYSFSEFTIGDLVCLVDKKHWKGDNYSVILGETNGKPPTDLIPNSIIAPAIYIVRCAIVHSKLDSESAALLPPYTLPEINALTHLVEDVRGLLKCLLF